MVSALSTRAGLIFKRALRVLFVDDPGLKFISLLLALILWFYIDGEIRTPRPAVPSVTEPFIGPQK